MPTNKGAKYLFGPTPISGVVAQADWTKIDWVNIEKVINGPNMGVTVSYESQTPLDGEVTSKSPTTVDAGDETLEIEYRGSYEGQDALEAAAASDVQYIYPFCKRMTNAANDDQVPTVIYGLCMIGGPVNAGGDISAFANDTYALAFTDQKHYRQPVQDGTAPTVDTAAAITGTPTVGETLTAGGFVFDSIDPLRTITYQWLDDDVEISGATDSTFVLTAGQTGGAITVAVTCTTAFGSVTSTSAATAAVSA